MKHRFECCGALAAALLLVCGSSAAQATPPAQNTPAAQATPATNSEPTPQSAPADQTSPPASTAPLPDAPGAPSAQAAEIVPTGPTVIFDTSMGRMTCKLFDTQSPLASANFIGLAEGSKSWTDPVTGKKVEGKPFYDGTTFHRVIPGFMIQGGDRRGDGTGDPGFYFDDEKTPGLTFDVPGRLAMANSGPNTNGSQFFITELPQPDLNGRYTIFGQCDSHSVLIAATIARVDRNPQDKPLSPVVLDKVTIVREGQPVPPVPPPDRPTGATPGSPATPQPAATPQPGATPPPG